jgi:Ni/Fe-hydrogenase subunit HybB-like protein
MVGLIGYVFLAEPTLPVAAGLEDPFVRRTVLTLLLLINLVIAGLATALWFKTRQILATLVAAFLVLVGMWLERWNIIIPTLTHPYLVDFSTYTPTITEISITAGSLALFILLFVLFFKLFPVISIWEVAEGRVIEEENNNVSYPMPAPSNEPRRRWGFRR